MANGLQAWKCQEDGQPEMCSSRRPGQGNKRRKMAELPRWGEQFCVFRQQFLLGFEGIQMAGLKVCGIKLSGKPCLRRIQFPVPAGGNAGDVFLVEVIWLLVVRTYERVLTNKRGI